MKEEQKSEKTKRAPEGGSDPSGPASGDLFASTVKSVRDGIFHAVKDAADGEAGLLEAVAGTVHTSMRGVVEAGGSLVLGAKAILVGVLRGTGQRETAALKTLTHTSRAVIRYTARLSGNLSDSLKGLVLGAIASARDIGVERAQAASAAAQGAVEGAEEAGTAASDQIRRGLREDIGGIHVALPESIKN